MGLDDRDWGSVHSGESESDLAGSSGSEPATSEGDSYSEDEEEDDEGSSELSGNGSGNFLDEEEA